MDVISRQIDRIPDENIRQVARDFALRLYELGEVRATEDGRWLYWECNGESVVDVDEELDS